MKTQFITILLSLFISVGFAQNKPEIVYDTDIMKIHLERLGLLDDYYKWHEKAYSEFNLKKNIANFKSVNAIRYIPVIVHVIHNSSNPSDPYVTDAEIIDMIQIANADLIRQNADASNTRSIFDPVVGDSQINLCLASQDPDGNPTSGIERIETVANSFSSSSSDMKHTSSDGADGWNGNSYLNLWICNMSDGASGGVAGFSTMPSPGAIGTAEDGIVLDANLAIGDYNGVINRTLTHEFGHYMGLDHPWGTSLSCAVDDGFTDTPTTNNENMSYRCDTLPEPNSCTAEDNPDLPDQFENFMSYATCQNMFTAEQCAFMNSILTGDRYELLSSLGCQIALNADFLPASQVTIPNGGTVTFTDQSTGGPITWNWTFPGGNPATYYGQNPPVVTYNTVGVYNVVLSVNDGTNDDTETKTLLVNVVDNSTWPIAIYTSNNSGTEVGGTIIFADASLNNPTDWQWTFNGGTPSTFTGQNPGAITYNVPPGIYDVTLYVSNAEGYDDTVGTVVVVTASGVRPVADFAAPQTRIFVNGSVDFYDLSYGEPFGWDWKFYGPASQATSTQRDPQGIVYSSVGQFAVSLTVSNSLGMDSLRKDFYITVVDELGDKAPIPYFTVDERLISVGESITFHDQSIQDPVIWEWQFEGGVILDPINDQSHDQNPINIIYPNVGTFDVRLTATNAHGSRSLTKFDYIVVTSPENDLPDYCNTLSNVPGHEDVVSNHLSSTWGWMPGHNGYTVTAYADYFVDYTYSQINTVNIPIRNAYSGTDTSSITVYVWKGTTNYPDEIMASKNVQISSMSPSYFNPIHFDEPVLLDGPFFLGYEIYYTNRDTFATYMAEDRGPTGANTAYVRNSEGNWSTFYSMFGVHTSMLIEPDVCLVGVEDVFIQNDIFVFPNPSNGIVNIGVGESVQKAQFNMSIYDLFGRKINTEVNKLSDSDYQIDLSKEAKGIYLIHLIIDNKVLVKKISIM